jgi:outer membrane protein OmpA-like peptidoglycan-associated protein
MPAQSYGWGANLDASADEQAAEATTTSAPHKPWIAITPDPPRIVYLEFERDSARPKAGTGWSKYIEEVVALLRKEQAIDLVEVDGFADPRTDKHPTVALSLRRAQFVVKELVAVGTDAARLRAVGLGPYCRDRDAGPYALRLDARYWQAGTSW